VKITTTCGVVDVTVNPGRKSDGRPNAGLEYTASLRCSSEGVVRLTLGTDFTPPCLLAVLPSWDQAAALDVVAHLGLWIPAPDGWTEARPGVFAFIDGVRYQPPTDEELEFMAAFGFTPGARFDLALPMLRAQRAQLNAVKDFLAGVEVAAIRVSDEMGGNLDAALTAMAGVDDSGHPLEFVMGDAGTPASPPADAPVTLDVGRERAGALVDGSMASVKATRRQRRPAKPVGKVEVISQVLGESTSETLVPDAAIADVFDVLDAKPTPPVAPAAPAPDVNPFMIEGL
jgi:hypothetical protein